jgi:hypothetical protein
MGSPNCHRQSVLKYTAAMARVANRLQCIEACGLSTCNTCVVAKRCQEDCGRDESTGCPPKAHTNGCRGRHRDLTRLLNSQSTELEADATATAPTASLGRVRVATLHVCIAYDFHC